MRKKIEKAYIEYMQMPEDLNAKEEIKEILMGTLAVGGMFIAIYLVCALL